MYITLTAAFHTEEQPDFEGMNIKPEPDDFEDVDWMEMHVHYDYIANMHINEIGNTNLHLITGEVWTVKESPDDIISEISSMAKRYK